jgi:hypothetical protein
MGESDAHTQLVLAILRWIDGRFGAHRGLCVLADLPARQAGDRPWRLGAFVPDVVARTSPPSFTLVGEAKLPADLATARSRLQLASFVEYLTLMEQPLLVVATPPIVAATARTIVRRIQRELRAEKVETHFITG